MAKILLASLKAILNWLGGARCRRQEAISEPYWTALTLTLVFVTFGISLSASRMCLSSQLQARSKGTEPQWLQTERWPNASMIGKDDLKCCTNPWTTSRTKPQCRARCRRKIRRPLGRHLATSFYATKRGSKAKRPSESSHPRHAVLTFSTENAWSCFQLFYAEAGCFEAFDIESLNHLPFL